MKHVMVQYRVKSDRAAENEKLILSVFEQLQHQQPSGLHYASFKLKDGVSFVHVVSQETTDGRNPLTSLSAFNAFAAGVRDRCDQAPVTAELTEIGSYGVFGK